jgi:hypothetical protein
MGGFSRAGELWRNAVAVKHRGSVRGPDIEPGAVGEMVIELPPDWRERDVLLVTAIGPDGSELFTWSKPVRGPQAYREARFESGDGRVSANERGGILTLAAGPVAARFDLATGRLVSLRHGGHLSALTNGPRWVPVDVSATEVQVSHEPVESGHVVDARQGRNSFRWMFHPSGWLELEWQMDAAGAVEHAGITFDHPESETLAKRWFGRGPQRVWRNRMQGPAFGAFTGFFNDPVPGRSWAEPEFKGCFADMHRLDLVTRSGTLEFLTDTCGLFARIHTPQPGHDPMRATASFPEGDLSFLHLIPAIGTKFRSTNQLGPQSSPQEIESGKRGRMFLNYTAPH